MEEGIAPAEDGRVEAVKVDARRADLLVAAALEDEADAATGVDTARERRAAAARAARRASFLVSIVIYYTPIISIDCIWF